MGYSYTGYGDVIRGQSYATNSGLSYNQNVANVAQAASGGNLDGFDSAYNVAGGCTWWASGRSQMANGRDWGGNYNAAQWFDAYGSQYGVPASSATVSDIEEGDVLCFDNGGFGHVAFVESKSGSTIRVSESAAGSNNYNVLLMSSQSASTLISNKSHWFWSDETFEGILKGKGSAPSPTPPDPGPDPGPDPDPGPGPHPQPGGGWEFDYTGYVTIPWTLCRDQQNPSTPTAEEASGVYPTGDEIQNVRWSSITEYTDERQIVYDPRRTRGRWLDNWYNISTTGYDTSWGGGPGPGPGPGPTPGDDYKYYDAVIEMPESKELDFLYTADIHCGWKDYGGNRWNAQVFSLDKDQIANKSLVGGDVKAYQNKLIAAGIPTYLLDCGDWSKGANYRNGNESACVNRTIEMMKGMNYFGITTGNWEWKWNPISTAFSYLNQMRSYGLMACNVNDSSGSPLFPGGRHPDFPGCKAIKVGDKKIALIAVGYPSPNGYDTYGDAVEYNAITYRWNYKEGGSTRYRFFDSSNDASIQQNRTVNPSAGGNVYARVQRYIDEFKNKYGFNYIIVFTHMDKYSDENYSADNRFFSRADFMIMNTSGINAVIPGHLNAPIENTYTYRWKNNAGSGIIAPEAGGEMNSFGRLRINLENDTISFKLLKSLNDIRTA